MKNKTISACLIGNTNSGKSTFLNLIVGENISIVNKKRNTTIDFVSGILNLNNIQIVFYDTPGLNNSKYIFSKNYKIKNNFWHSFELSKIILYFYDVSKKNLAINKDIIKETNNSDKILLIILNKIDLIKKNKLLPLINEIHKKYMTDIIFPISAKFNIGTESLLEYISSKASYGNWMYTKNEITNKSDEFISREITRNSLLRNLNCEIPYKLKVNNYKWKIVSKKEIVIYQEIIVNKKNYKKIIIGKSGKMVKKIREDSQKELKKIFNKIIHLYIKVIVTK